MYGCRYILNCLDLDLIGAETQDAEGPFPWTAPSTPSTDTLDEKVSAPMKEPKPHPADDEGRELQIHAKQQEPSTDNPKIKAALLSLVSQCRALQLPIVVRIPQKSLITGCVLRHALAVTDGYLARHRPMVFKFGFSHSPLWRWRNPIYGYCHDEVSWTEMIILHMSHEAYGPAMLEACLINRYQGTLPSLCKGYAVVRSRTYNLFFWEGPFANML